MPWCVQPKPTRPRFTLLALRQSSVNEQRILLQFAVLWVLLEGTTYTRPHEPFRMEAVECNLPNSSTMKYKILLKNYKISTNYSLFHFFFITQRLILYNFRRSLVIATKKYSTSHRVEIFGSQARMILFVFYSKIKFTSFKKIEKYTRCS
jgi:hypothetical protein